VSVLDEEQDFYDPSEDFKSLSMYSRRRNHALKVNPVAKRAAVKLKANSGDDKQIRMRYLRRLTQEQIWLAPMKQPKNSQNLVIFDWDDTLFPTTYLNPVDDSLYEALRERFSSALYQIEDEAIKLI